MKTILATLGAAVLLGACSTPQPEHFYTLSGGSDTQPAKPVRYYVEMLAVSVPQQVSRNQFVVTAPSGRIAAMRAENSRTSRCLTSLRVANCSAPRSRPTAAGCCSG